MTFQTEKQLKELESKIGPEVKAKLETANEKLKEAVKGGNAAAIKTAMDALNNTWNEASSQMYQQATSAGPQGPAQGQPGATAEGSAPGEKKVEDAQYEVVDDKDKDKEKK